MGRGICCLNNIIGKRNMSTTMNKSCIKFLVLTFLVLFTFPVQAQAAIELNSSPCPGITCSYQVDETDTNMTFTYYDESGGKTVKWPKANTEFKYSWNKISPKLTFPKSELASRMINVNASVGYIKLPYWLSETYDYINSNDLGFGAWKFKTGSDHISIYDNNGHTLATNNYTFRFVGDEIRLYFVKPAANVMEGDISFEMHSWEVNSSSSHVLSAAGEYYISENFSCASTCINITADNVFLNSSYGNKFQLNFSNSTQGVGIYASGRSNITIENISIVQESNISTINNTRGIHFSNTKNSSIKNVMANVTSHSSYSIYLASSSNNNTLTQNNGISNLSYGIYLSTSSNNTLTQNNGSSGSSFGIFLFLSNNNTLTQNNGSSGSNIGIFLYLSGNNTIQNNSASRYRIREAYYLNKSIFVGFGYNGTDNINIYDVNSSFVQNDTNAPEVETKISSPSSWLNRSVLSWTQSNMTWYDNMSAGQQVNYSFLSLKSNTNYSYSINSTSLAYNITNSTGPLMDLNFSFTRKYNTSIQILEVVTNFNPNITSWANNKTNNNTLSFQINTTDTVMFNVTSNQTGMTWNWTVNDYVKAETSDTYNHTFLISNGTVNISVYGTNANGTTQYINWSIYVLDNGSEFTLSGYVLNELSAPLISARVDFGGVYDLTDANGYYEFTGIGEATYEILVRQIGYTNLTSAVLVNSNESINFTLNSRKGTGAVASTGFDFVLLIPVFIVVYALRRKYNT